MFCCPLGRTQRWLYRHAQHPLTVGEALLGVGGAALLLLIGIHNAWDNITHQVLVVKRGEREANERR